MDATAPEPTPNGTAEPQGQPTANTPTAYWQIATALITSGKLTQDKAREIAKADASWTDKAARLAAA